MPKREGSLQPYLETVKSHIQWMKAQTFFQVWRIFCKGERNKNLGVIIWKLPVDVLQIQRSPAWHLYSTSIVGERPVVHGYFPLFASLLPDFRKCTVCSYVHIGLCLNRSSSDVFEWRPDRFFDARWGHFFGPFLDQTPALPCRMKEIFTSVLCSIKNYLTRSDKTLVDPIILTSH